MTNSNLYSGRNVLVHVLGIQATAEYVAFAFKKIPSCIV